MSTYRSRIKEFFPKELVSGLYDICMSKLYSNVNAKIDDMHNLLVEHDIPFNELGPGTHRYAVLIDGYVFKIALSYRGVIDNWCEFALSKELQPYVTKTYESNGLICVAEYVTLMSKEEFLNRRPELSQILHFMSERYLLGDMGLKTKNFVNWGMRNDGTPVVLDFAHIYKIKGTELICDNIQRGEVCGGSLEYDLDYHNLVCPKCKGTHTFVGVRLRVVEESEFGFIDRFVNEEAIRVFDATTTIDDGINNSTSYRKKNVRELTYEEYMRPEEDFMDKYYRELVESQQSQNNVVHEEQHQEIDYDMEFQKAVELMKDVDMSRDYYGEAMAELAMNRANQEIYDNCESVELGDDNIYGVTYMENPTVLGRKVTDLLTYEDIVYGDKDNDIFTDWEEQWHRATALNYMEQQNSMLPPEDQMDLTPLLEASKKINDNNTIDCDPAILEGKSTKDIIWVDLLGMPIDDLAMFLGVCRARELPYADYRKHPNYIKAQEQGHEVIMVPIQGHFDDLFTFTEYEVEVAASTVPENSIWTRHQSDGNFDETFDIEESMARARAIVLEIQAEMSGQSHKRPMITIGEMVSGQEEGAWTPNQHSRQRDTGVKTNDDIVLVGEDNSSEKEGARQSSNKTVIETGDARCRYEAQEIAEPAGEQDVNVGVEPYSTCDRDGEDGPKNVEILPHQPSENSKSVGGNRRVPKNTRVQVSNSDITTSKGQEPQLVENSVAGVVNDDASSTSVSQGKDRRSLGDSSSSTDNEVVSVDMDSRNRITGVVNPGQEAERIREELPPLKTNDLEDHSGGKNKEVKEDAEPSEGGVEQDETTYKSKEPEIYEDSNIQVIFGSPIVMQSLKSDEEHKDALVLANNESKTENVFNNTNVVGDIDPTLKNPSDEDGQDSHEEERLNDEDLGNAGQEEDSQEEQTEKDPNEGQLKEDSHEEEQLNDTSMNEEELSEGENNTSSEEQLINNSSQIKDEIFSKGDNDMRLERVLLLHPDAPLMDEIGMDVEWFAYESKDDPMEDACIGVYQDALIIAKENFPYVGHEIHPINKEIVSQYTVQNIQSLIPKIYECPELEMSGQDSPSPQSIKYQGSESNLAKRDSESVQKMRESLRSDVSGLATHKSQNENANSGLGTINIPNDIMLEFGNVKK